MLPAPPRQLAACRCDARHLRPSHRPRPWVRAAAAALTAALLCLPGRARADCIDDAAAYHGVDAEVLRAIGYQESHLNPRALNRNRNGSEDLGMFQINTIHLPELARYGIARPMLFDPCVSAYVGAWHLARKLRAHGDRWWAIGAYHSETPAENGVYARAIERILARRPYRSAHVEPVRTVQPAAAAAGGTARATAASRATMSATAARATVSLPPPQDDGWLDDIVAELDKGPRLRGALR